MDYRNYLRIVGVAPKNCCRLDFFFLAMTCSKHICKVRDNAITCSGQLACAINVSSYHVINVQIMTNFIYYYTCRKSRRNRRRSWGNTRYSIASKLWRKTPYRAGKATPWRQCQNVSAYQGKSRIQGGSPRKLNMIKCRQILTLLHHNVHSHICMHGLTFQITHWLLFSVLI